MMAGGGFDEFDGGQTKDGGRSERSTMPKKPPPISDDELQMVDPTTLARDELLWAVGRAANLKLAEKGLWRSLSKAIVDLGENNLLPSELCRLVQALAYAPKDAPLDERLLQSLLRAFANRSKDYSDEQVMRIVYGYGKLAAKRGLSNQRFLDFAGSEVVERKKFKAWRKVRILNAVWHLKDAGEDFRSVLVAQVGREMGDLDTETWRIFVPMLVERKLHERPQVLATLNKAYKQKIFCYKTPDLLLRSGAPMVLHDLMKTTTLVAWLNRLHDLRLPITPDMVDKVPLHTESDNFAEGPPSQTPAGVRRATENLELLKIVELCLRHERPGVMEMLPHRAKHLVSLARNTPLEPPEDFQMPELPFIFARLGRLFRDAGLLLHPIIYGPYLLELADPLGRLVIEWDANWTLYPPWRRRAQEDFTRRKHRLLAAEGWTVLCVSQAELQAQSDRQAQVDFLRRFASEHSLDHLRLED